MGKYDPLENWLEQTDDEAIPMGFSEIEHVLGFELPPSSRTQRAWWSNNPSNNVMTKAWLDAGFETANVDMEGKKLVFKRMKIKAASVKGTTDPTASRRSPLFGALKGLMMIPDDLDLTQPAMPEWADLTGKTYGPERG